MKIIHTGDLHIKAGGLVSLEQQEMVLSRIGDLAEKVGAKAIVVAGDIFDGQTTPAERNAADRVFTGWANVCSVIVARGNHDPEGELVGLAALRAEHRIFVFEKFHVMRTSEAVFVIMPWPSRARVAAWIENATRVSVDDASIGVVRSLLTGARAMVEQEKVPVVFVGHLEIGSATTDGGQPIAGRCDIEVGVDDLLEVGASYYALGHIHKPQTISEKIRYCGSPRQTNFGEAPGHGATVYDTETGEIVHVELPSPKFTTVEATWTRQSLIGPTLVVPDESIELRKDWPMRLVYSVPESERAMAREAADQFASEFSCVKVEPDVQIAERETRSEVTASRDPSDKLRAFWDAKGETPARSESILAKLSVLY